MVNPNANAPLENTLGEDDIAFMSLLDFKTRSLIHC